ncbi:CRISPR-associated protein Cas4 [Tautonia rosea]|uniref:CRISPR-associated protein Cas4 n=1 Tax=Tautonia rosea TaxID=2728037 RepID=UPI0014745FBC|nr:PD-(D/E)XK nuclease family protein [Tautonia rosea]
MMENPEFWLLALAILLMIASSRLRRTGQGARGDAGLSEAETVSLDGFTMTSRRYGLRGRPDRLIRSGSCILPEEWKSSRQLHPWHLAQLGTYFILIEEHYGVRPPCGFVVLGDGTRHRVANTEELREQVLAIAGRIREARQDIQRPIAVRPGPARCRPCPMWDHCDQAVA